MRREELEHVIRAAAEVCGDEEIAVVGSQAILGEFPDAPEPMLVSQEADVYPWNHPERAIEIDGALGDGSRFHEAFGYYAHGVGPETAQAPADWQTRLVRVEVPASGRGSRRAVGLCLGPHDLVLAKCVAGRPRDREFTEHALRHGLVEIEELRRRVPDLPLPRAGRDRVDRTLRGIAAALAA